MENYVSVQVGCLRFLNSYRFLSTNLDKLVKSINSFPIMDENGFYVGASQLRDQKLKFERD